MAEQILIGPHFKIGSTNLSAWVEELTIKRDGALEEFVTSNVGGTVVYKRRIVGPIDFSIDVKFSDDFATSAPHQTLAAVFGTTFVVEAALNGPTPAATNEVWTDTMTYGNLTAGGAVGSRLSKTISFVHASGVPVADITP